MRRIGRPSLCFPPTSPSLLELSPILGLRGHACRHDVGPSGQLETANEGPIGPTAAAQRVLAAWRRATQCARRVINYIMGPGEAEAEKRTLLDPASRSRQSTTPRSTGVPHRGPPITQTCPALWNSRAESIQLSCGAHSSKRKPIPVPANTAARRVYSPTIDRAPICANTLASNTRQCLAA